MEDGKDPGNAFAIPDLWASSTYFPESEDSYSFLFSQLKFEDISEKLPDQTADLGGNGGFFSLPDFTFESPELSTISTNTPPPLSERGEEINNDGDEYVDIWSFAPEEELKSANYLTWDAFDGQRDEVPQTCYVSEGGPQLFDAAVADDTNPLQIDNQGAIVVSGLTYASSLLALGLGRDSVLFTWNEEIEEFECTLKSVRTSGCTTELTQDVTALFLQCGNTTKALRSFTDKTYVKHRSPGRIALADAVATVLSTLQSHLNIPPSSLQSILKLQSLFQPVSQLLTIIHSLILSTSSSPNDEILLSHLFQFISQTSHRTDSTQTILLEILSRVSRPFLDFAGEWLGIQRETGVPLVKGSVGKSFVKAEERLWIDEHGMEIRTPDFLLDEERVPSFMQKEDMQILFEAGRSLRLLREHQPGHPLARGDIATSAATPVLEWEFSWQKIEAIGVRARQYEKDLTAAIEKYSTSGSTPPPPRTQPPPEEKEELNLFGKPPSEMEAHLVASLTTLTHPPLTSTSHLSALITTHLKPPTTTSSNLTLSTLTPLPLPLPLTPHLSLTPFLTPLSTSLSTATLTLLLSSALPTHLSLHRSFSLLGSGVFASRLAHALFDPSLSSAERHRGVVREGVMGLRLGSKGRSWPPGGSELRLVLAGVLSESYAAITPPPRGSSRPSSSSAAAVAAAGAAGGGVYTTPASLPGDLSFGVRHMSPPEIAACLDATSLSALDFLRLVYHPPAPLDAVITPESLHMYDRAFRALLRCLRVQFVMGELFRASKAWDGSGRTDGGGGGGGKLGRREARVAARFRNEAQHFVNAICAHFESGVTASWALIDKKMEQLARCLQPGGPGLAAGEGVEGLRRYHERVLERMMGVLLLRGRQGVVRGVLEEVLGCIIKFGGWAAGAGAASGDGDGEKGEEGVEELYRLFRSKVRVFITICRGMEEKKGGVFGDGDGRRGGSGGGGLFDLEEVGRGDVVGGLLGRLEGSGYYT